MRLSIRQRGYFDALGVLICEVVLLATLLKAGSLLGTVDLAHFAAWLRATSPQRVVTSCLRLLGTAVSGWLLLSTVVYGAAALSGRVAFVQQARPVTLPALRRILDAMAAASVAASSVGSSAALASASAPAHPVAVVRPLKPPRPVAVVRARTALDVVGAPSVSSSAVGRHFPHPGALDHELPETPLPAANSRDVPSQANGFAGLPRGTKVVVVEPGDCLSVLAERHLGDWRLDSEIEALNFGRLQPDGRALVNDHWIYPGWVLVLPPNAFGAQVVGEANAGASPLVAAARAVDATSVVSSSRVTRTPRPKRARRASRTPRASRTTRARRARPSHDAGQTHRKQRASRAAEGTRSRCC